MKSFMLPVAAGVALIAGTASAQTAPATAAPAAAPTAGATVYDTAGAEVGTIDSVTAQAVVINTGTNKVPVPPTSVGPGAKGLTMAMTKVQLDAAFQQSQAQASAQLQSALTAGAEVRGLNGAVVGKVKSTDAQGVTVTTAKGDVKLPTSGFAMGPNGPVIGMTAEQLDAAMTGATASTPN